MNMSKQKIVLIVLLIVILIAGILLFTEQGKKKGNIPVEKEIPIAARFDCQDGSFIEAKFFNKDPRYVDLNLSDRRQISVPQAISASGARYANADESFVFWNKGDTAFIEEGGKTTFTDCATK
jgi:membrane-bound inhibitor of C-type lysozyme